MKLKLIPSLVVAAASAVSVYAQEITPTRHGFGVPDPSFAPNGSPQGGVRSIVRSTENSWLIGGAITDWAGAPGPGVYRISEGGQLDETLRLPIKATSDAGLAINRLSVLPDQRFVAAGKFTVTNSTLEPPPEDLFRFMPDGSLDPSFTTSIFRGVSFPRSVLGLAVDSKNRILVAGTFRDVLNPYWEGLIRLNPDGSRDPDFHPPVFDDPRFGFLMTSVLIEPDDSILVAGMFLGDHPGIMRLNPDGTIDEQFHSPVLYYPPLLPLICSSSSGGGGIPNFSPMAVIHDLAIDARGRIIAGGAVRYGDDVGCANVIRLLPNGSPDPTFNTDPLAGTYGVVRTVAIAGDGTIVIGTCDGKVVSLREDGSLAGLLQATSSIPPGDARITALAPLADGRIWIGGSFTELQGLKRPGLTRVIGAPFLTPPQADGGTVTTRFWTVKGRQYQLESSGVVDSKLWKTETTVDGDNAWHLWSLPLDQAPSTFIRLRVDQ